MNPLRWDVLLVGLVFCLPVLLMGLRNDLTTDQMTGRLPWCLLAGWVVVAVVRAATTPPPQPKKPLTTAERLATLGLDLDELASPLDAGDHPAEA
jgi:Sec-independent protein secretion pathway component TatC